MSCTFEGLIEIPIEEFHTFLERFHPKTDHVAYGIPRIGPDRGALKVSFAGAHGGASVPPAEWGVKPAALAEWDAIDLQTRQDTDEALRRMTEVVRQTLVRTRALSTSKAQSLSPLELMAHLAKLEIPRQD